VSPEFKKDDSGKPRFELLPSVALEEVAKVLTYGAKKYTHDGIDGSDNWRLGTTWRRYIGASLRHIFAFLRGEDSDPETGCSHLAHAVCCLLFLLEFQLVGGGTDDRVQAQKPEVKVSAETIANVYDCGVCTKFKPCTKHACTYWSCHCEVI
jgi:hypothetical protein